MNIELVLTEIADTYHLNAHELIAYSYEDAIGGWDKGRGEWPVGSLWSAEGRILYALVRALKPAVCVEIGTWHGCSTTHIAAALKANDYGILYAIDDDIQGIGSEHPERGAMIPDAVKPFIKQVTAKGEDWLRDFKGQVDFVYEDADHSAETTRKIWISAQARLAGGGMIVSHDAMHYIVGKDIRRGILDSGASNVRFYKPQTPGFDANEQDFCGLALWRSPIPLMPEADLPAVLKVTKRKVTRKVTA